MTLLIIVLIATAAVIGLARYVFETVDRIPPEAAGLLSPLLIPLVLAAQRHTTWPAWIWWVAISLILKDTLSSGFATMRVLRARKVNGISTF